MGGQCQTIKLFFFFLTKFHILLLVLVSHPAEAAVRAALVMLTSERRIFGAEAI
jgi:hypothetical protein